MHVLVAVSVPTLFFPPLLLPHFLFLLPLPPLFLDTDGEEEGEGEGERKESKWGKRERRLRIADIEIQWGNFILKIGFFSAPN